jgi:hypothetical protein
MPNPFGDPVAQNVAPMTDGVQTLSAILGLKQKQQALQTGQYLQQSAQAAAQQDQQTAQQRSGIAAWMQNFDPTKHVGPDGTLDLDNVMTDPKLRAAAGDQFPDLMNKLIQTKQFQLDAKGKLAGLNDTLRNQFSSTVASLRTDPDVIEDNPNTGMGRSKVKQAMQDFAESGGPDAARVANIYGSVIDHVPKNDPADKSKPSKLVQTLSNFQLQAMDASTQAKQQAPANTDTGGTIQNVNPQAAGGNLGVQPPITKTIPPGYMQGPNGSIIRANNAGLSTPAVSDQGSAGPPSGAPTGAKLPPIQRPGLNAPAGDQQRYTAIMEAGRQHYGDVSGAANDLQNGVGPTRYRNDQIQDILNSKTFSPTGPGAAQLNWISSKIPGQSGDAFQKIGHYLAQNSAAIAQKMGVPGTNMGSEQAAAASGSTSQNKGALLEITKVNDAMNTALDMYNRGLAKVSGNGADPSKVPAYRQAFGQNFDMNVLRYDDALRRNDKAEIDKIKQEAGPNGLKAMGAKRKVLHSLADTGELP